MGEAARKRQLAEFNADLASAAKRDGKIRCTVEGMTVIEGMMSPRFMPHVAAGIRAAVSSIADPARSEGVCECFGCCRAWSPDRGPYYFGFVTWLRTKQAAGVFLCADCAEGPGPQAAMVGGLRRDFGLDPDTVQELREPTTRVQ
jgi:hypothetical protein